MHLFKILTIVSLFNATATFAQTPRVTDTAITNHVQVIPEYPGGLQKFARYITKSLQYPEVAYLLGLEGKVQVSFIIERDGTLTNATPVSCIGAGCESEAVRVIANSKPWKPGTEDGKPVRVIYNVPINFNIENAPSKLKIKKLKKSDYGFVINMDGKTYTLDEAEKVLGDTINPKKIISAEQCFDEKYWPMPDKKEVYLLILSA